MKTSKIKLKGGDREEIKNKLNDMIMYSELSNDKLDEIIDEIKNMYCPTLLTPVNTNRGKRRKGPDGTPIDSWRQTSSSNEKNSDRGPNGTLLDSNGKKNREERRIKNTGTRKKRQRQPSF